MDVSQYYKIVSKMFGVPRNFLQVVNPDYYIPTDMQDVSGVGDLSDGKVDAVGLLYSDQDVEQYPTFPETD